MYIVFVHGIFSDCGVFDKLKATLSKSDPGLVFLPFNYPFLESLSSNADRLVHFIAQNVTVNDKVVLICHSMGGLVARMAICSGLIERELPLLFMLGTPNHGAIKTSQIKGIASMVRRVGKIRPLYSKAIGLDDLTRVNSLFLDRFQENPNGIIASAKTDYITIPGLAFNDDSPARMVLDRGLSAFGLGVLTILTKSRLGLELTYPHDGIVEENSVRMVIESATSLNERTHFSSDSGKKLIQRNANVHIIHPSLREADHLNIHSCDFTGKVVSEIIGAGSIDAWIETIPLDQRVVTTLMNGVIL